MNGDFNLVNPKEALAQEHVSLDQFLLGVVGGQAKGSQGVPAQDGLAVRLAVDTDGGAFLSVDPHADLSHGQHLPAAAGQGEPGLPFRFHAKHLQQGGGEHRIYVFRASDGL